MDGRNGKGNRTSIGIEICYSKSGGARFDAAEKNAAKYIASLLKARGWGIDRVKRHKDWSGKYCPHRTMDYGWQRFLNMISAELNGVSNFVSQINNPSKLAVDGNWGVDTTKKTQKVLGTYQDGIVSSQTIGNKKYLVNCSTYSWKFVKNRKAVGSAMVKAIQRLVGATVDGYCGKGTITAMQKFLNAKGYSCGTPDGYMGPRTVKAWQMYINSRLK